MENVVTNVASSDSDTTDSDYSTFMNPNEPSKKAKKLAKKSKPKNKMSDLKALALHQIGDSDDDESTKAALVQTLYLEIKNLLIVMEEKKRGKIKSASLKFLEIYENEDLITLTLTEWDPAAESFVFTGLATGVKECVEAVNLVLRLFSGRKIRKRVADKLCFMEEPQIELSPAEQKEYLEALGETFQENECWMTSRGLATVLRRLLLSPTSFNFEVAKQLTFTFTSDSGKLSESELASLLTSTAHYLNTTHAQATAVIEESVRKQVETNIAEFLEDVMPTFGTKKDKAEVRDELDAVLQAAMAGMRKPWIRLKANNDDDDNNKEAADSSMTPADSIDCTIHELCVCSMVEAVAFNEQLDSAAAECLIRNSEALFRRIREALETLEGGCYSRFGEPCECEKDLVTHDIYTIFAEFFMVEKPRFFRTQAELFTEFVCLHPSEEGMCSVTALLPFAREEVGVYFDALFEISQKYFKESANNLLIAAARFEPPLLKRWHADDIQQEFLKEKISSSDIPNYLMVFDAIAENRPDLMSGKGEGYYEALLRTADDQEVSWLLMDNIMKCIALQSPQEAARILNLMIGSCQLITAKSHLASVLEDLQSVALVYPEVVEVHRPWIETIHQDKQLRKTAAKLIIILDNCQSGVLKGSSSSSTCTVS